LNLGEVYKKVPKEGFKVLRLIDSHLSKYEYLPQGIIAFRIKLPPGRLEELLETLVSLSLIKRRIGSNVGYRLTYLGLSILSLKSLVDRGIIEAVGDRIGVGKESEIYEALSTTGERLSLKLHMVGKESFKKLVRVRHHIHKGIVANWLIESKKNASREYRALTILSQFTDNVPRPVGYNRNAVVTEFIEGLELYRISSLSDPMKTFYRVLYAVATAYKCAGIIHGDLSEYNIMIRSSDEEPIIIDWPQYIAKESSGAAEALRRDICYVSRYFNKKFELGIDCSVEYEKIITDSYKIECSGASSKKQKGNERDGNF